ncbi:Nucleotide-binding universal stress protein, UspA family [Aquiflexum balticum DSM 16537]|uniref:Nucleotide-binding universal stress protein, UspA family n=2 Tax=Aquiflexum TaxID=280472 RepID=A0A1W2GZ32_9BACT|nr:Nucleotide-binding universal stress protein, UspA family [Aquiflexum balticum DSM 16537]
MVFYKSTINHAMFKKIALAIAFSPRLEALICEAKRIKDIFSAELLLIHVGEKSPELENNLQQLLTKHGLNESQIKTIWQKGNPANKIIQTCTEENVDFLVAGALKTEGFFKYYIGSIARKIIRKAKCSVLILVDPLEEPTPFQRVVINGTQQDQTPFVIEKGLDWCKYDQAKQVFIVNEIKMYGFQMATAGEGGEEEISNTRRKLVAEEVAYVENILNKLDKGDLKVSIKITCGKWGVELARFATDTKADLLIVGDEGKLGFLDRLFPHDLEDILSDLPCNLLILKNL